MRYVLVTLSLMVLPGCATTGTAVTAEGVCSVWPSTSYSQKDTPETIKGNRINNARRSGFCGKV